jgi:hypothetical protein
VGEGEEGKLESHPDEVWYRLSLDPLEAWKKISINRRATGVGLISNPAYGLYSAPLPMVPAKVKDLAKFRKWSHKPQPLINISPAMDHLNNPLIRLPLEFHSLYPDYDDAQAVESKDVVEIEDEDEPEEGDDESEDEDEDETQEPIRRKRSGKDEKSGAEDKEEEEEEEDKLEDSY